jgi:5-methylcytosine-specific restriction endonuclease McrA
VAYNSEKAAAYYKANREWRLEAQKIRDSKRKEQISLSKASYYQKTKEVKKAYVAKYRKENPGKVNALNRKHYSWKLQRTPTWLSKEQFKEIQQFYIDAIYLTNYTKVNFEVDHIIPLKGKLVSGLHVPWNLQLLTEEENIKKSNKL